MNHMSLVDCLASITSRSLLPTTFVNCWVVISINTWRNEVSIFFTVFINTFLSILFTLFATFFIISKSPICTNLTIFLELCLFFCKPFSLSFLVKDISIKSTKAVEVKNYRQNENHTTDSRN